MTLLPPNFFWQGSAGTQQTSVMMMDELAASRVGPLRRHFTHTHSHRYTHILYTHTHTPIYSTHTYSHSSPHAQSPPCICTHPHYTQATFCSLLAPTYSICTLHPTPYILHVHTHTHALTLAPNTQEPQWWSYGSGQPAKFFGH